VRFVAIAGDARDQAWPLRLLPPGDGVVTLSSALALDPRRFGHAERVTRDVHAPSAPTTALGWHDLLTHLPTYRDVVRPAVLGAGGEGKGDDRARLEAVAPSGDASIERVWPVLDLARGPVERAGEGDALWRRRDASAFFVAAPAHPVGRSVAPGAGPSPASAGPHGGNAGAGAALVGAIARAPDGAALDAGRPFAAADAAAILAPWAVDAATGAPDAHGFAAFAPSLPHPILRAESGAGALRLTLEASDGRPLDPVDAWLEVLGARGEPTAWRAEGGELTAVAALPPGAYAVRAGVLLDGRRLEALATVAVPDPGAVRPRAAAWCPGVGGAGLLLADVEVRGAGRYLIGLRGLDGAGRVVVATAGWRTLPAGSSRIELAAAGAGGSPRRIRLAAMRDDLGPVPAGGGEVAASACRRGNGAPSVAPRPGER